MTDFLGQIPGIALDKSGRVAVDKATMQTGNAKYFAGGDCVNGGREAVDAAQMGKLAAMGIHQFVTAKASNSRAPGCRSSRNCPMKRCLPSRQSSRILKRARRSWA